MKHARPDYNRIQDPAGLIPQDEPVFLLRAQDATAADTVRHWATLQLRSTHTSSLDAEQIADLAFAHARAMDAWPIHKPADLPQSPSADLAHASADSRPQDTRDEVIAAFQHTARKVLQRIAREPKFAHVMHGTDCYSSLLQAYAASLGKTLSQTGLPSSMMPIEDVWYALHKD